MRPRWWPLMGLVTVVFVTVVALLGPEVEAAASAAACAGAGCADGPALVSGSASGGHQVAPAPAGSCVQQPSCGGAASLALAGGAALLAALTGAAAAGLVVAGRHLRRRRPRRSILARGQGFLLLRPPRFA